MSPHTRKSILTSTDPTTHLLDLHRNVFLDPTIRFCSQVHNLRALCTYKSLELTTATRLPTVINHTPTKFYNII